MKNNFRKKDFYLVRGFTIVEVIVAIAVFGIAVLAIAGFFVTSAQTVRRAGQITVASNLASGFIDENLAKSFAELTPGTSEKVPISEDEANPYHAYKKQTAISCIDSNLSIVDCAVTNPPPLKKILVTVFWQEGTNEKNIEMSTIKTNQ